MPGIVVFKRRWSVGSDDLVVPAVFLVILHVVWIVVLGVILGVVDFETAGLECAHTLRQHVLGYLVILSVCAALEAVVALVAMRGSILYTEPRTSMQYLLYTRLGVLAVELVWLILGVIWVTQHYQSCDAPAAKRAVLGIIVCNWCIMLSVVLSLWCTFDTAGRSWVKMKRYQESIKERQHRAGHKRRSGSRRRNWRHRKALRAYEESWDRRCKVLFCCVREDRNRNSFTEVAKLFTEFFRDLDVVPSDVVAGLVLLRQSQKHRRKMIVSQGTNDVYQFLSGVPITPSTRFLRLMNPDILAEYRKVIHYMRYALAAYGWPMYMMMNTGTGLCKIMPYIRCCGCLCPCNRAKHTELVEDNCCQCNLAALKKLAGLKDCELDLIYVTYHVDIGETPFFVAVDHEHKTVVISIRGTLSLQDVLPEPQDVLTDLKADAEQLPVDPPKDDWLGHKGMVHAAVYIRKKIKEEMLLSQAFGRDLERGTQSYELVLVGHSLGAGTAAILAILLRQEYPNLHCYAYSPPGGLLSATAVEETKDFITSVVVGKDVVPRIGLHQLEAMRQDLINVIKKSTEPKWKIIMGTMMCCCGDSDDTGSSSEQVIENNEWKTEKEARHFLHPSDSQIALTTHAPLYPPGRIIHIVRNHPRGSNKLCGQEEPVYQAIWADNIDFDEVLISPTMVNDHMPDNVMEALQKVLINVGPSKPARKLPEAERKALLSTNETPESTLDATPPHKLYLETSFTNTNPPEGLLEAEYLNRSSGAFSIVSDANSLSWDYAAPMDVDRRSANAHLPHHLMPPGFQQHPHAGQKPARPNFKLDLPQTTDDWPDQAPLATPETLSDTSSVDSGSWKGSRKFTNGYQRLTTGMPTMEPIQQSPLRAIRSEGYHYFIPVPSPVEYHESPEREYNSLGPSATNANPTPPHPTDPEPSASSQEVGVPLAQSTPMKMNQITTEATVESAAAPPTKPPRVSLQLQSAEPPEKPLHSETATVVESQPDMSSFDLTAEERKLREKLTRSDSANHYKLTFEDESLNRTLSSNTSTLEDEDQRYVRHSPDEYGNQVGYDPLMGHYSHGGRGYPHGGYMSADEAEGDSETLLLEPGEGGRTQEEGGDVVLEVNVAVKGNNLSEGIPTGVIVDHKPPIGPPHTTTTTITPSQQQQPYQDTLLDINTNRIMCNRINNNLNSSGDEPFPALEEPHHPNHQNGLPLVHTAASSSGLPQDVVVTSGPGRPRLKPYSSTSSQRARSSTPEDEFGRRLSAAPSDEVFILDTPNIEGSTDA